MENDLFELPGDSAVAEEFPELPTNPFLPDIVEIAGPVEADVTKVQGFRIDLGARAIAKAQTMNWHDNTIISATVLDASGTVVRSAEIRATIFAPHPLPMDVIKTAMLDSAGLPPGRYQVKVYARWLAMAGWGIYVIVGAGGQLSTEAGPIWGKVFEPTREVRGGEFARVFEVELTAVRRGGKRNP